MGGIVMLQSVILLIVGFVILIKGADFFVSGASGIAEKFHIPQIIIGLTIVAFGTSAPEAAISISAALSGTTGIAIGNILGSNLLNVLFILGLTACVVPLHIGKSSIQFDIPFNLIITLVLVIMGTALGKLNLIAGMILWALMVYFLVHLFRSAKKEIAEGKSDEPEGKKRNIVLLILFTLGGLAAVVLGSNLAVDNAKTIAYELGMDERLIGLTIVAFGTSLPELMTSVMAARKGNADIAVGNILGSNIFNILFVLGTVAVITPVGFAASFVIDGIVCIVSIMLLYFLSKNDDTLSRTDGVILLVGYALYFLYLLRG